MSVVVFMVEEASMEEMLRGFLPVLFPDWVEGVHWRCIPHEGKSDLEKSIPRKLRAEIDAYVAHLYGLSRDDFAYILDTFPVLKKKEEKAFGEFMSKRKCLEEYDRLAPILNDE